MTPKLAIFTTHVVDLKLVIAINHSILRISQKLKINWNLNFVGLIFLFKLKCNKDHVYGFNCISANTLKNNLIHYMVICFYCKICFYREGEISRSNFSIECCTHLA
jgi:hypothetical protein